MELVAYPRYLREKARQLRTERNLTLDEIAERLALPRTTVYYWIRDVPIPETEKQSAARFRASRANSRRARGRREAAYREGQESFPSLIDEPGFRDFVCLYIAEGYKRCRNTVSVANSDPAVVKLCAFWMRRFSRNPVTYSVQFHADQVLVDLQAFWSDELGVEPAEIKLQRKSNSSRLAFRQWRSKYGVLSVRASDTIFRARLQAWIDCLQKQWLDSI